MPRALAPEKKDNSKTDKTNFSTEAHSTPRYGQYLTHAHTHITWRVAASPAWSCAMLMSPNEDETAVCGCYCQGVRAVRMRKVLYSR